MKNGTTIAVLLILAFTFSACGDRDVDGLDGADEYGAEGDMTTRDAATAENIVAVSILDDGDVMPTLPAGQTTLTVDNTGREDCTFTMQRISDSDMPTGEAGEQGSAYRQGTAGSIDEPREDGSPDDAISGEESEIQGGETDEDRSASSPNAGLSADDRAGTPGGEAGPGTLHGGSTNRIAAGQASTVTMDLEPGIYEASCTGSSGTASQEQADPLIVMVADVVRTGDTQSRRGSMDDNAGTESSPGASGAATSAGGARQ